MESMLIEVEEMSAHPALRQTSSQATSFGKQSIDCLHSNSFTLMSTSLLPLNMIQTDITPLTCL